MAPMADPVYYTSSLLTSEIWQKEHILNLYLREGDGEKKDILGGDDNTKFGYMGVADWAIYDGPEDNAKLVARAQGQHLGVGSAAGAMLDCFSLAFTDKRFKKSSLKMLGEIGDKEGECAIIGGTGAFAFAQGVVTFKKIKTKSGSWTTRELHVRAITRVQEQPDLTPSPSDTKKRKSSSAPQPLRSKRGKEQDPYCEG